MLENRSSRFVFFCLIYVILLFPVIAAQEIVDAYEEGEIISHETDIIQAESPVSEGKIDIQKEGNALREEAVLHARNGDFEKALTLINEALKETNNAPEGKKVKILPLSFHDQLRADYGLKLP